MDITKANNEDKVNMIVDRFTEIIKQLPNKQANLLAYILEPRSTAIGASFSYNEQLFRDNLRIGLSNYAAHLDANGQFTLNQVCDMINKGEI